MQEWKILAVIKYQGNTYNPIFLPVSLMHSIGHLRFFLQSLKASGGSYMINLVNSNFDSFEIYTSDMISRIAWEKLLHLIPPEPTTDHIRNTVIGDIEDLIPYILLQTMPYEPLSTLLRPTSEHLTFLRDLAGTYERRP